MLTAVVASGFLAGRGLSSSASTVPSAAPSASASASASPSPTPSVPTPTPTPESTTKPAEQASPPTHGSGKFAYASTRGPVLGSKGKLRRFKVAVEQGSNEDVTAFAEAVAATLGDPRSWIGGGNVRLQMVAGADKADFTVYLATRDTAGKMCQRGGTNIRINGVPYTSCRTTGQAIINLDRWRLSAKPYLNAKVPLATYRQYVVNHEVGHELGHRHEGCPKAGGPAPVMVQQTLTTRGCVPYAWPRRGNGFLTGPAR
ncbi:lipoprotein [Paractinoplanes tereljensis]|uniref:Lipoprotein n=1 Tax=Paractinoplanes tereljensis TaxID=571912 RepID=A0A919NIW6_9ACTN|nr:lipoprotein [Actinoplanes tereljensis]